jgi:putative toxin-antitoxin system antitoxin component (TIGR02293 family)
MPAAEVDVGFIEESLEDERPLDDATLHSATKKGVSYGCAKMLKDTLDLTDEQLAELLGISAKTLDNRKEAGHIQSDETDRLLRAFKVIIRAKDFLGSTDQARSWLKREQYQLGDRVPLNLIETSAGTDMVLSSLGRIEHSVAV